MNKLVCLYQNLLAVHDSLDILTKVALLKVARESKRSQMQNYALEKFDYSFQEISCDFMAYANAINVKFKFYFDLSCRFLKLYLKENHKIQTHTSKQIFEKSYSQNLISEKESKQLIKLKKYIGNLTQADAHGNYEFENDIMESYGLIHQVIKRLKPKGEIKRLEDFLMPKVVEASNLAYTSAIK